jgi:hypothetical protein
MRFTRPQKCANFAKELREESEYLRSAAYYVAASDGWLMRYRHLPEDFPESEATPNNSPKELGRAIHDLLFAILCFRIADELKRGRNHAKRGEIFVRDLIENEDLSEVGDPESARVGLGFEMIGDLNLFAASDGHQAAYSKALTYYKKSDYEWGREPEFESLIDPIDELAESGSVENEARALKDPNHQLESRIQYKKTKYGDLISQYVSRSSG